MKRIIAFFLISTVVFAVENPYQEVMRILEKSKIKYNLSSLTSPVSAENRSGVLNGTAYRVKTSKGFQVKGVNFAPEAKKYISKLKIYFRQISTRKREIYTRKFFCFLPKIPS